MLLYELVLSQKFILDVIVQAKWFAVAVMDIYIPTSIPSAGYII